MGSGGGFAAGLACGFACGFGCGFGGWGLGFGASTFGFGGSAFGLGGGGMGRDATAFRAGFALALSSVIDLLPIFDLRWTENRGVSLGLLTADSMEMRWALVVLTALIAAMVFIWMLREQLLGDIIALAMVLGGALGNIRDRVNHGFVIDYADLHFGEFRPFLIFNLADAAITIGVLIILARSFLSRDQRIRLADHPFQPGHLAALSDSGQVGADAVAAAHTVTGRAQLLEQHAPLLGRRLRGRRGRQSLGREDANKPVQVTSQHKKTPAVVNTPASFPERTYRRLTNRDSIDAPARCRASNTRISMAEIQRC